MNTHAEGIWIIDSNAITLYVNGTMAEILGTSTADLMGNPSFQYVYPEDVTAAQRLFDSKQRGDSAPFHFRLRRKDGFAIWVDVQGTPMHNVAGEFLGIVGTFRVSERQG
jgi:PAS domain S-box-containing protein